MRVEEFFDPFAVLRKPILQGEQHFHQAQGKHAFGPSRRFAAAELGGFGEEFHSARSAFGTPQSTAMQELPTDACQPSPVAGASESVVKTSRPRLRPNLRRLPRPSDNTLPRHVAAD